MKTSAHYMKTSKHCMKTRKIYMGTSKHCIGTSRSKKVSARLELCIDQSTLIAVKERLSDDKYREFITSPKNSARRQRKDVSKSNMVFVISKAVLFVQPQTKDNTATSTQKFFERAKFRPQLHQQLHHLI